MSPPSLARPGLGNHAPKGWSALLGVLLLVVQAGCDRGDVPHPGVDSAAICQLAVSRLADLGKLGDPQSIPGRLPNQVAHVAGGGWAVLEQGFDVLLYDSSGDFRGTLGTPGEGPLELTGPESVVAGPGDSLWVSHRGGWVVFAADGTPARSRSAPGPRPMDGITASGVPYKLFAAGILQPDGETHASLFVRRWAPGQDDPALEPLGPGVPDLERGARVGRAGLFDLVTSVDDTTFLVVGIWDGDAPASEGPGNAGVMRWTPSSTRSVAGPDDLVPPLSGLDLPDPLHIYPRGIAPTDAGDGYWLLGGVMRVSEGEVPALEEASGGVSWRFNPLARHQIFDGVIWKLDLEGGVQGVAVVDTFLDGVAGPDQVFTVIEDPDTGLRTVRVLDVGGC